MRAEDINQGFLDDVWNDGRRVREVRGPGPYFLYRCDNM